MFLAEEDREREERIAARLSSAWQATLIHMPMESFVDFVAVRHNRPVAWVEVISRDYAWPDLLAMGGVVLKYDTLMTLWGLAETPLSVDWLGALVVYDLTDGLYCVNVSDIPPDITPVPFTDPARRNRNDVNELVAFVTNLRKVPE